MGREEKDLTKRKKIDSLLLSDEEWTSVKNFLGLLGVGYQLSLCPASSTVIPSMQIVRNKLSRMMMGRRFTWLSPHSRRYTRPGPLNPNDSNTPNFLMLYLQGSIRLPSIMRRLQSLKHIFLPCVRTLLLGIESSDKYYEIPSSRPERKGITPCQILG